MTIAALIIIAGTAALAAALAFGAAFALSNYRPVAYPLYWFAVAGAIVGAAGGGLAISGPGSWFSAADVAVEDVLPYMQEIKRREPALYERIETSVIRDQLDGLGEDRVRANAKALVTSYVADKAIFLADDLTYDIFAGTRDSLAYLGEHSEWEACAQLALGRGQGDIDAHLSKELVERNANNTLRVIAAAENKSATQMPAEEFAQIAAAAFGQASQVTGIPPEEVDAVLAGRGEAEKTCRLMRAFFDAMLAHPVQVAAAALRTMASGERRMNQL